MKKNFIILALFLISGIAIYKCHQLSSKPESAYQLYLEGDFYVLKDGERVVWKGKAGGNDQIDQIVLQDNL